MINLGILGKKFFFKRILSAASNSGTISKSDDKSLLEAIVKGEEKYISDLVAMIERYQKPVIGVSLYDEEKDRTIYPVGKSIYKGLFYPTPERAVAALSKMVGYGRFLQRQQAIDEQNQKTIIGDRN
ncbi:hypothetical protein KKI24_28680 [bacterium]|nr:hypothetical protein [bacterium]